MELSDTYRILDILSLGVLSFLEPREVLPLCEVSSTIVKVAKKIQCPKSLNCDDQRIYICHHDMCCAPCFFKYLERDVRELTDSSCGLIEEYRNFPEFHKYTIFEKMICRLEDSVSLNDSSSFSHYVKLHYEQEFLCDFLNDFEHQLHMVQQQIDEDAEYESSGQSYRDSERFDRLLGM